MIDDKGEWCFLLPHVDDDREIEIFLSPAFSKGANVSFISDSIVVSAPVNNGDERGPKCAAILSCIEAIKALQRSLLMLGLRSRGGVSIGGLIHSGELIIGDGLLRAYEIERSQSINPRTVIDQVLIDHLLSEPDEHFPVYINRVAHSVRQDNDGLYFVDYLSYSPTDGYCGLGAEFPFILEKLVHDRDFEGDKKWIGKVDWLLEYASASFAELNSQRINPIGHGGAEFCRTFPRTNETLVEFLRSEISAREYLKAESHQDVFLEKLRFPLWPSGWAALSDDEKRTNIELELRSEVSPGHLLYGRPVRAIGRYRYSDEFLFSLEDGRVAEVHFTWHVEGSPDWPCTSMHPSFLGWADEWRGRMAKRKS
jgi:hypothetical protein